jgi:putative flippase GtrA
MIALRSIRRAGQVRLFIKFIIVSGINTVVGYALFASMVLLGAGSGIAVIASTTLGTLFNFASTGRIVFGSSTPALLPRFIVVYAGQCIVNLALLDSLERSGAPPLAAQAMLIPFLAILTFMALRHFVFKGRSA